MHAFFQMMSFETNPYSWKKDNITGTVGSVSLTRMDGTVIPVENLPDEVEVRFIFRDTSCVPLIYMTLVDFSE